MKNVYMVIGTMLLLALCITPVAAVSATPVVAVSGDDFEVVIEKDGYFSTKYIYGNMNNPDEKYTKICAYSTVWDHSLVTFKPANVPDAPVLVIDITWCGADIYLPRSVDIWEIKMYMRFWSNPTLETKYLTHKGVVDINYKFGKYLDNGLHLRPEDGGLFLYGNPITEYPWVAIPSV